MANPSTVTTDAARDAAQAGRRYIDRVAQLNRELIELWTSSAEGGLQTVHSLQTAAVETGQSFLDASTRFGKDAMKSWAELARAAQSTTLKTYQTSARLFEATPAE